jgi:hypothetical protein
VDVLVGDLSTTSFKVVSVFGILSPDFLSVAEKTFLDLRKLANKHPNLHCIAISHCTKQATDKWMSALGGSWAVEVVIDEEREIYASWGLGISTAYYLLNPWTQMAARKLGTGEGIWGREVGDGGNRWQIGGAVCIFFELHLLIERLLIRTL